jgi:hypothetical protein
LTAKKMEEGTVALGEPETEIAFSGIDLEVRDEESGVGGTPGLPAYQRYHFRGSEVQQIHGAAIPG